ncbi:MAG: HAD family phosphatase [Ferruginibacter sp.]
MKPKAFLFDMNGTMIDDMQFHAEVWHDILNNDLKANLTKEETKSHMYGKNEELFERIFEKGKFTHQEMDEISLEKERRYQASYKPHLKLINGLDFFLAKASQHKIALAIGTAAKPFNVNFVLDHIPIKKYFGAIVTADDVFTSKPHPEVFIKCADELKIAYGDCVVFEDAPKGVEAALNAGMKAVAITSYHQPNEFIHLPNILMYVADYTDPQLDKLFKEYEC